MLILNLNRSSPESAALLLLHGLAVLGLSLSAMPGWGLWLMVPLLFLSAWQSRRSLANWQPPALDQLLLQGRRALLLGNRRREYWQLVNARSCGDWFTLLELRRVDNRPDGFSLLPAPGRRGHLLLSSGTLGRRNYRRLRRYLRFALDRGDGKLQ